MSDLLGAQLGQRRLNDLLVQAGLGPQPLTKVHNEVSGGRRKAELRRIFLMEAANKVAQAEERVRKREVRLAELEEKAKELKDKAAQRGGTAASGAVE